MIIGITRRNKLVQQSYHFMHINITDGTTVLADVLEN